MRERIIKALKQTSQSTRKRIQTRWAVSGDQISSQVSAEAKTSCPLWLNVTHCNTGTVTRSDAGRSNSRVLTGKDLTTEYDQKQKVKKVKVVYSS